MESWLEQARMASGLTVKECAYALSQTEDEFLMRQDSPGLLSLNELNTLVGIFNNDARFLVWDALQDFKP